MIYLASPYSSDDPATVEWRFRMVCAVASGLMSTGHHVFSPIAHTHPIALAGGLPTDFAFWREYDEAMIAMCDEVRVLCLPGWEQSRGVRAEIAIAATLGIPVSYIDWSES